MAVLLPLYVAIQCNIYIFYARLYVLFLNGLELIFKMLFYPYRFYAVTVEVRRDFSLKPPQKHRSVPIPTILSWIRDSEFLGQTVKFEVNTIRITLFVRCFSNKMANFHL